MDIILRTQTRLSPTSIVKDSNTIGAVTDIDEEVDSPDGSKLEVVDETANFLVRVQFTPPPSLTPGGGLQRFRAFVLKNAAGGTDPYCGMSLVEAGASLRGLASPFIESESGEVVEGTFDIAEVVNHENTECRLDGVSSGNRNIDIDAVEWVATHGAGILEGFAVGTPTLSAPTEIIASGIDEGYAAGTPSLGPVIEAEGILEDFAVGTPSLSNVGGEIVVAGILEGFGVGTPSLGIFSLIAPPGILEGFAVGEPTLVLGTALISAQGIGPEEMAGIPVLRRLDVQPDLENRLKPGSWRMS